MTSKNREVLGYVVYDTKFTRTNYPGLIGKGFIAPANYRDIAPYRTIKTTVYMAPDDYIPKSPALTS